MDIERLVRNPLYVLELRPGAGRAQVEEAGQRIRAMLEMGMEGADRYRSPRGEHVRDLEAVRQAVHLLRDPAERAVYELWALLSPEEGAALVQAPRRLDPWPEAVQDYPW